MPRILLSLMDHSEAADLARRTATIGSVSICRNLTELSSAALSSRVDCIVIDLVLIGQGFNDDFLQRLFCCAPVIIRASLSGPAAREIVRVSRWLRRGQISLSGFDDLSKDIEMVIDSGVDPTPDLRLAKAAADVESSILPLIIGTAVLGRKRTQVATLARACAIAPRTLEWRLSQLHARSAQDLLGWSLGLHSMWRIDVLDWPLKRAALAAGFSDADTLAEFVNRHVGLRPRRILREGGFDGLLRRWKDLLPITVRGEQEGAVD